MRKKFCTAQWHTHTGNFGTWPGVLYALSLHTFDWIMCSFSLLSWGLNLSENKRKKKNLVSFAFFPVQFGLLLHPNHSQILFYLFFFVLCYWCVGLFRKSDALNLCVCLFCAKKKKKKICWTHQKSGQQNCWLRGGALGLDLGLDLDLDFVPVEDQLRLNGLLLCHHHVRQLCDPYSDIFGVRVHGDDCGSVWLSVVDVECGLDGLYALLPRGFYFLLFVLFVLFVLFLWKPTTERGGRDEKQN